MNLLIKCINCCLLIIIIFSCGGGRITYENDSSDNFSDEECKGTCFKGTLIDTVGGTYPIAGAKVSTIPSVNITVTTGLDGVFLIDSYEFLEDVKYNINIQKANYIANSPSNITVRLDTIMNLYEIILTKMPTIDTYIDSIRLREGGGGTPKSD